MRILHGYSSIGLIPGLLTCALTFPAMLRRRQPMAAVLILVLLVFNVVLLNVNTWVAIQGMGIPHGNLFHLALASAIVFNLFLAHRVTLNPAAGAATSDQNFGLLL